MSWVDELENGAREAMLRCRANCMPEVDALLLAGWRFELPEIVNRRDGEPPRMDTEPWQWYWRSPPKRKNSKGRKYWSTTMAYNALKRLEKNRMKTYVIEWRLQGLFALPLGAYVRLWTPLEGEEWLPESAAQERLKYWQGLSLSKLLEFRVDEIK